MLSISNYVAIIDKLFADNHCTKIDIKNDLSPIGIFDESIFYWIDGMRPGSSSNIAFYIHLKQTNEEYVERVVLTSAEKKTLGARYYDPKAANSKGFAPYMIFNQIDLKFSKKIFLVVQVKTGNSIKIYRYTLDTTKLSQSKLHMEKLPLELMSDFKDKHAGQCYSSYHFQVKAVREQICNNLGLTMPCFNSLFPTPKIKSISENSQFSLDVLNRYPDISSENYMRYFFLTDPVGRHLAIHKRNYQDNYSELIPLFTLSSDFWKSRWGVVAEMVPRINDCPYLLLFSENPKYGIFYSHIWLR
ncbi:MAG: hypothetical protein AB8G05_15340 [Oligoflexales bacterium]